MIYTIKYRKIQEDTTKLSYFHHAVLDMTINEDKLKQVSGMIFTNAKLAINEKIILIPKVNKSSVQQGFQDFVAKKKN